MKRKDVFDYIEKIENENETIKNWGNLYEIEKAIIEFLTQTRIKKGLTQKDLAKITGLKQSAIARIENNVNSPQLDTFIKLVDALELNIIIKDKCL